MFHVTTTPGAPKHALYRDLAAQAAALLAGEGDGLANTSNVAALLYQGLPDLNWAGFYFLRGGQLVLGPFQGRVACVRIELGRGVCGTAAARRETVIVPDVALFPGHIACDPASRSEIVIPLVKGNQLIGVLDVDSPSVARFDSADAEGLGKITSLLLGRSEFRFLVD